MLLWGSVGESTRVSVLETAENIVKNQCMFTDVSIRISLCCGQLVDHIGQGSVPTQLAYTAPPSLLGFECDLPNAAYRSTVTTVSGRFKSAYCPSPGSHSPKCSRSTRFLPLYRRIFVGYRASVARYRTHTSLHVGLVEDEASHVDQEAGFADAKSTYEMNHYQQRAPTVPCFSFFYFVQSPAAQRRMCKL